MLQKSLYIIPFPDKPSSTYKSRYLSDIPYNVATDEKSVEFEIYLAGYTKDQIKLYSERDNFFVEGNVEQNSSKDYAIKNVILKSFKYTFDIHKSYEFESSRFVDGVLYVKFNLKENPSCKKYVIE